MYAKSSPAQQDVVAEVWTADLLVLGQALYHWATLSQAVCILCYYVANVSEYIALSVDNPITVFYPNLA